MVLFSSNKYSVGGKVALVTGALGAIGQQISLRLVELGARVVLVDIVSDGAGETLSRSINESSQRDASVYIQADMRSLSDVRRMLDQGISAFGQLDILVNNAGLSTYKEYYVDEDGEGISALLDINLRAPMESTRLFVKYLQRENIQGGVIVNMASISGLLPVRRFELYGTTKAALIYFTEANRSLAPQVRVTAVAPYFVDSPMVRNSKELMETSFVNPSVLLRVDQVVDAVVERIENLNSGGKCTTLVGSSGPSSVWIFRLAYVSTGLFVLWYMFVGYVKGLFGFSGNSASHPTAASSAGSTTLTNKDD
ncbi:NAD(P)-binding protein [Martensiomyces pterosporus]|nr:NAD(P)-binding protein [Martensiomyces pterosporus]